VLHLHQPGFPGFRVKLWMVDPATKSYLGVLEPVSVPGSVWYELADRELGSFLADHRIHGDDGLAESPHVSSAPAPMADGVTTHRLGE